MISLNPDYAFNTAFLIEVRHILEELTAVSPYNT
jgi:hypothetical protein